MANSRLRGLVRNAEALRRLYPHGQVALRAGTLRWVGPLQPSVISATYRVEVIYRPPRHPVVRVRSPALIADQEGELPHIYPDGSLCLYEAGQWCGDDLIAETIVPWSCEWLLHYEFWRATGTWHGSGGDHTGPVRGSDPNRRRSKRRKAA